MDQNQQVASPSVTPAPQPVPQATTTATAQPTPVASQRSRPLAIVINWLTNEWDKIPIHLIRMGLIFVFCYAAISMSLNPAPYVHYLPPFVRGIFPPELTLHAFSIYEIILSLWLFSGKKSLYAAIFAFMTIFSLTAVNGESFTVVFRNVAIIFSTLALVALEINRTGQSTSPSPQLVNKKS